MTDFTVARVLFEVAGFDVGEIARRAGIAKKQIEQQALKCNWTRPASWQQRSAKAEADAATIAKADKRVSKMPRKRKSKFDAWPEHERFDTPGRS